VWNLFDDGKTIGAAGSESGVILCDEEHSLGARITLERDTRIAPFAITCGIYGWMLHTCFLAAEPEALVQFESMKTALAAILDAIPLESDPGKDAKTSSVCDAIGAFVERFP
jgi:hypothetical protein